MCTMSDTVEITTSIITEIGSSMIPMSMCSDSVNGSQLKFHGVDTGRSPSAVRCAVKYPTAVI